MVTPMDLNHLGPAQQEIAGRSDDERVRYILSDRWVPYRVAQLVEDRFRFLIDFPKRSRMPCLLVSGDPGMGKSLMAEKFIRDYPTAFNEGTGATIRPALYLEMPDEPTPQAIREELLGVLGAPPGKPDNRTVARLIDSVGCRLLFIDEVNKIGDVGPKQQTLCLTAIRTLHNSLKIPLVALGTPGADIAIRLDPALAERFEVLGLPHWGSNEDMRELLLRVAAVLPLRRSSTMDTPRFRRLLIDATSGVTSRIFRLLETVAIAAIRNGQERIDEDSLSDDKLLLPLVSMVRNRRPKATA
jgi:hypothetical protein